MQIAGWVRACPTGAVDLRKYTDSLISSHLQHAILATSHHRVCWIRHSTHGCWQAACTGVFGRTENALDVIGLSFGRIFARSIKSNSCPACCTTRPSATGSGSSVLTHSEASIRHSLTPPFQFATLTASLAAKAAPLKWSKGRLVTNCDGTLARFSTNDFTEIHHHNPP